MFAWRRRSRMKLWRCRQTSRCLAVYTNCLKHNFLTKALSRWLPFTFAKHLSVTWGDHNPELASLVYTVWCVCILGMEIFFSLHFLHLKRLQYPLRSRTRLLRFAECASLPYFIFSSPSCLVLCAQTSTQVETVALTLRDHVRGISPLYHCSHSAAPQTLKIVVRSTRCASQARLPQPGLPYLGPELWGAPALSDSTAGIRGIPLCLPFEAEANLSLFSIGENKWINEWNGEAKKSLRQYLRCARLGNEQCELCALNHLWQVKAGRARSTEKTHLEAPDSAWLLRLLQ